MNFLSHLYLSGNSEPILIGNFIGDFVKGKQLEKFPNRIATGIRLHREIDFFTDNHSIVNESKKKLRAKHGHYAGVVVDMFYDHFLAVNWDFYNSVPLEIFAQKTYSNLLKNKKNLPEKARYMLPYMVGDNWLVNYAHLQGIDSACKGIAKRTKFKSNMETAVLSLQRSYEEFHHEFKHFFPELELHCKAFLNNIDQ